MRIMIIVEKLHVLAVRAIGNRAITYKQNRDTSKKPEESMDTETRMDQVNT